MPLQRGNWARVRDLLEGYREESMAVLPALAQESYVRAYPHMVRLHMMQVGATLACSLLLRVTQHVLSLRAVQFKPPV